MRAAAPTQAGAGGVAGSVNGGATAGSAGVSTAAGNGAAGDAAAGSGAAGRAASGGAGGSGTSGSGAGGSGAGGSGSAGVGGDAASGGSGTEAGSGGTGAPPGLTPIYRIPLRVHTGRSELTEAELMPILAEVNSIWLEQAGICFEIEVTASEDDRSDGFDFRYTSGQIPGASGSNGVYMSAHSIWSIDQPRLNDVMTPVMHPTARTTAHELGHALGLAHENPPPSSDCDSPCHCVELGDDCDEYLMRSGTKGFHLSQPEVEIARTRSPRFALSDQAPARCGTPTFMQ